MSDVVTKTWISIFLFFLLPEVGFSGGGSGTGNGGDIVADFVRVAKGGNDLFKNAITNYKHYFVEDPETREGIDKLLAPPGLPKNQKQEPDKKLTVLREKRLFLDKDSIEIPKEDYEKLTQDEKNKLIEVAGINFPDKKLIKISESKWPENYEEQLSRARPMCVTSPNFLL